MNILLQYFASGSWEHLVRALLHTLWQGAAIALVLCLGLRQATNPVVRYRLCFLGLCSVLLAGLVTWAVLDAPPRAALPPAPSPVNLPASPAVGLGAPASVPASLSVRVQPAAPAAGSSSWTARLAVVWLAGLALMLARAFWAVAGAKQLRSGARLLENEHILRLVRDAQSRLGLVRQIRVVVTEKLTSPAVAGVLVPTLVLPLSLTTTLSVSQLQLIVLHELAHIRRRDYLANLFQLLLESLLFFNPAVWWLSRQVRQEREACCDALAVALAAGQRVEYARALAEVAERSLESGFISAPAFSAPVHGSGLRDRIQRLLVPGYRPGLRLSWQGLAGSLLCGGLVLMLSAFGTQWTVKAAVQILTPQQRIERIETNLKSLGHDPEALAREGTDDRVEVRAVVRTRDGSPLPRNRSVSFRSSYRGGHFETGSVVPVDREGDCQTTMPRGDLYLSAWLDGFAPAFIGPIDIRKSNTVDHLELVLERGFPISIRAVDETSGAPLADAALEFSFFNPKSSSRIALSGRNLTTDQAGTASLPNCASLPLHVTLKLEGYETVEKVFERLKPNDTLQISTRRSLPIAGWVTDQKTGRPVEGASLYVLSAMDAPGVATSDPWYPGTGSLTQTDPQGRFLIDRLPRSGRYWLVVRAPGFSGVLLADVRAGQTNLVAALGPEMVVKGRLTGDLSLITRKSGGTVPYSDYEWSENGHTRHFGHYLPVRIEDGAVLFEYTNPVAGPATVCVGNWRFTTNTSSAVEDWLIHLPDTGATNKRKVVLRFEHPSRVPPKGTIEVELPDAPGYTVAKERELQNGEVLLEVPVGRSVFFKPAHTVGYWFAPQNSAKVEAGSTPLVVTVPVVPAGAIYAQAFESEGTVADKASFQIIEVAKSPRTRDGVRGTLYFDSLLSQGSSAAFAASSLPLDGTYRVVAHRDNSFCASEPITLTDQTPDRKVELRFRKGVRLEGQVLSAASKPLSHASVGMSCRFLDSGFGLASVSSDEAGRFHFENCQPGGGTFLVDIHAAGLRSVIVPVDLGKLPLVLRLEPGLKLSGRVLNSNSGQPVPSVEVRAWDDKGSLPSEVTRTDSEGRFEFTTLSDVPYRLYTQGSNMPLGKPGSPDPVILKLASGPQ